MAVDTTNFTTGPSVLPDVGKLSYNGCVFSPLFETKLSGKVVKDNANRTTKYMEYTLSADGYVTLQGGADSILPAMNTLRDLLTRHGGPLVYEGRGFDLIVNPENGGKNALKDVAWGPVPELIEFQPLGAGRSAKIQWKVTVRIPEVVRRSDFLQLNFETTVTYNEDGYSVLAIRGTMEISMTRLTQADRKVVTTVDALRETLDDRITSGIDFNRFRVTQREFSISRDKRTLEFSFTAEERPYMDLPPNCTIARGTYNVRPVKVGIGLAQWLCTLKATYTVRRDAKRRDAWTAFLALLHVRMGRGKEFGDRPAQAKPQAPEKPNFADRLQQEGIRRGQENIPKKKEDLNFTDKLMLEHARQELKKEQANRTLWLIDFSVDEGLYLDSKTVTFSATWRLICKFANILLASGIWTKVEEVNKEGKNYWAMSMRDVSTTHSWLPNKLDPSLDVIVDFGGGDAVFEQ